MASRRVRYRRCGLGRTARSLRGWLPAVAGIWLAAAPVAVECAQFRPRATVRLVATGSTIANHPAGRLTADELANLIPAVERYAEVETEQFANLPNSSLTVEGSVGCVRVAIVLRLLRWWVHEEHYEPRPLKRVGVPIRRDLQAFQTTH